MEVPRPLTSDELRELDIAVPPHALTCGGSEGTCAIQQIEDFRKEHPAIIVDQTRSKGACRPFGTGGKGIADCSGCVTVTGLYTYKPLPAQG